MMFGWSLALISLVWSTVPRIGALELGESCTNTAGEAGQCIPLADCKPLLNIYNKTLKTSDDIKFLRQSRCGLYHAISLVCCSTPPDSSLPELLNCGIQTSDHIPDNQVTEHVKFPWTVLIVLQKPDGSFAFYCGGSLINQRHVITAAHFFRFSKPGDKIIRHVILGEWDLIVSKNCEDNFCKDATINMEVEKIIVHPDYVAHDGLNHQNNLALIRFAREIQYSERIRPICLPLNSFPDSRKDMIMHVSGWRIAGNDFTSLTRLTVELNVVDLKDCAPFYQDRGVTLQSTQICARAARLKDECHEDMGGPLMRQVAGSWYLIGVAGAGPAKCGMAVVPDIYTNITEYVEWIRETIE